MLADTDFYTTGNIYDVYFQEHEQSEKNARRFVRGSDGIYDDIALTASTFKVIKNGKKETRSAKKD